MIRRLPHTVIKASFWRRKCSNLKKGIRRRASIIMDCGIDCVRDMRQRGIGKLWRGSGVWRRLFGWWSMQWYRNRKCHKSKISCCRILKCCLGRIWYKVMIRMALSWTTTWTTPYSDSNSRPSRTTSSSQCYIDSSNLNPLILYPQQQHPSQS